MANNLRPARITPPGRILRTELQERGWSQKDLSDIIGLSEKAISGIVNGRKQITPETAIKLSAAFDVSAQFWINLEATYRLRLAEQENSESKEIAQKSQLHSFAPVNELKKRGWISASNSLDEQADSLRTFLDISSFDPAALQLTEINFRHSVTREPGQLAAYSWVQRVKQLAAEQRITATYSKQNLETLIPKLLTFSQEPKNVAMVPSFLSDLGVHFVIVPHLPQTYIDGAALLQKGSRPIVALTLRHDRIDAFWYSLIHELAHIVLEHHGQNIDRIDGKDDEEELFADAKHDLVEEEADKWASEHLIRKVQFDSFTRRTRPYYSLAKIQAFAHSQGRHSGIIVGRLQYTGEISYGHSRSELVKVRRFLEEWIDVPYPS